jgi:hypothetical protein
LALGEQIARELELNENPNTLSRWMAHHLADLLHKAHQSEGADGQAAEDRAVSLILKIWASRRDTPGNVDPLRRLENVISVMDRMRPESWPFRGMSEDTIPRLLTDAFDGLRTLVFAGALTTQLEDRGPIDAGVAAPFMNEQEQELIRRVNEWSEFIDQTPTRPSLPRIVFTDEQVAALDAERKREAEIEALPEPDQALRRLTDQIDDLIETLISLKSQLAARNS